ncbi:conserved Plasmodium protein, unknown function [Plasmodium vinckei brucechwatti]|uniref:SMP-30/Gluconolactonase/LRE-like region domain-containing protein n=1 Tax=Plasmodium vinckei brucechwatti TaxID=119398 RepID=A0A6V7SYV8_PLAVN|nr:conserved Plasmodium protein, unknown function [Plasmodium vinckei brucechwatti]
MDNSNNKINDNDSLNIDDLKNKKYINIEILYENDYSLYSPCIDVEGSLCATSDNGDMLKFILTNPKRDDENSNFSTSSEGTVGSDEDYLGIEDNEIIEKYIKKHKNKFHAQKEVYVNMELTSECLSSDNDYNFYIYDPVMRGLMLINKDKKMEIYADEFEDHPFKGINDLVYDKEDNILYIVDSGNMQEENESNLYYINKDIETMLPINIGSISYISSICLYKKNKKTIIYACLTKENRIIRLIKNGNSYMKVDFLYLNGNYSPVYICTNNINLIILLKDLSGCEKKGKILEVNINGKIVNSVYINGNEFNGICYDYNIKKYIFIEKNIIYTYGNNKFNRAA